MPTTPKAYSTIGTVLKCGDPVESGSPTFAQLCKIKSYPDLGGAPDTIETTDLEDTMQTFVPGVQSLENMEFTCNYSPEAYAAVVAAQPASGSEKVYRLEMGASGAQGIFQWNGTHTVYVTGGDVNAVREMVITVTPSTAIEKVTT